MVKSDSKYPYLLLFWEQKEELVEERQQVPAWFVIY
jgi:uncharacterized membrane protein YhfC